MVSLRLQNERLYIFLLSAAVALLQVRGQKVTVGGQRGDGGEARGLTEGRLLGIPTPHPALLVGGTVMAASLQASVAPVYWLFYTFKSNKKKQLS